MHVTPADAQDRAQVDRLAAVQEATTGETVEPANIHQGHTGQEAAATAERHDIRLEVVKLPEATHGFVLLPQALGS